MESRSLPLAASASCRKPSLSLYTPKSPIIRVCCLNITCSWMLFRDHSVAICRTTSSISGEVFCFKYRSPVSQGFISSVFFLNGEPKIFKFKDMYFQIMSMCVWWDGVGGGSRYMCVQAPSEARSIGSPWSYSR